MELDKHQQDEFFKHYGQCYLLHGDKLVFVASVEEEDRALNHILVREADLVGITAEKDYSISVKDLEIFNPESGYYNYKDQGAFLLTKSPKQQQQRGFSEKVASLLIPQFDKMGGLYFSKIERGFWTRVSSIRAMEYKEPQLVLKSFFVKVENTLVKKDKPLFPHYNPLFGRFNVEEGKSLYPKSVALSRDIALVKSKWGYAVLLFRKIPIGFYVNNRIILKDEASSYREFLIDLGLENLLG